MRHISLATAAVIALSITTAQARDVIGGGSRSCGSWLENQRDEYFSLYDQAWVAGYLSSYSLHASDQIQLPDAAAVRGWITKYCRNHPLDEIYKAADELVNELNHRASH
ncbi:hypothetical protein [Bradyrhizobium sp. Ash2021]|uniref:hypothetical protein n=1 Tax=Bradyrhizobium sp. Ash2021 TaxID=2954771 RepID=UPI002815B0A3|nr:hypothetical protein [Bradyrhizobium sp. Ash2021]WMT74556.1 hypothetical protein NL528_42925 [Bradyrhizobium sp. Ash2021]